MLAASYNYAPYVPYTPAPYEPIVARGNFRGTFADDAIEASKKSVMPGVLSLFASVALVGGILLLVKKAG